MILGSRVAIMSDIHGEHRMLAEALTLCQVTGVQSIVLLGDLFDRVDQAEACASQLASWQVAGVVGNHELDALHHTPLDETRSSNYTRRLMQSLDGEFIVDEAVFIHDEIEWKSERKVLGRSALDSVRVVFAGHTHYRAARDDHGPLDISLGSIRLRQDRRYLINPGALVEGQFAIWDRNEQLVLFERV